MKYRDKDANVKTMKCSQYRIRRSTLWKKLKFLSTEKLHICTEVNKNIQVELRDVSERTDQLLDHVLCEQAWKKLTNSSVGPLFKTDSTHHRLIWKVDPSLLRHE